MSKIERGQFSSMLRRYLGMAGVSDVVDELAPEISATFPLEVERPEWEWLKGAKLMSHATNVTVSVGFPSTARYRNPANSGVIAIFTSFTVSMVTSAGGQNQITLTHLAGATADLATTSGTVPRDTRNTVFGSAIIASFSNAVPGGSAVDSISALIGVPWRFLTDAPFVLAPGAALNVTTGNSVDLIVGAQWLEKRLDDLEKL